MEAADRHHHGNTWQVERAGQAVEQAEAEEQERRRHPAEEEILESGLGRLPPALVEPGEDVEREAGQFEGEEHQQQLLGGCHGHEADRGAQHDHDVLGRMADLGPAGSDPEHQQGQAQHADAGGHGEGVEVQHPVEDFAHRAVPDRQHGGNDHREGADQAGDVEAGAQVFRAHHREVEDDHGQRGLDQHRLGLHRPEELGIVDIQGVPPFSTAWKAGDCSAGVIQSKNRSGLSPTTRLAAISRNAPAFSGREIGS